MSATTKIEWTDATLSPWLGCSRVSEGCAHCYIERQTPLRVLDVKLGAGQPRHRVAGFRKAALALNRKAERAGRRIRVFPSLCDWLDGEVPVEWLADFLDVVRLTPWLDWQPLTKRPQLWRERVESALEHVQRTFSATDTDQAGFMLDWLDGKAPANAWIGATAESQRTADLRMEQLRRIPARVRFLSVEPMLGAVELGTWLGGLRPDPIHWVICGGESGPGARPMHPEWARNLANRCMVAGVPFFFKQWGEWIPIDQDGGQISYAEHARHDWPDGSQSYRVGKKAAGHLLDGREHQAMPEVPHA